MDFSGRGTAEDTHPLPAFIRFLRGGKAAARQHLYLDAETAYVYVNGKR
jgi:hypothetical protein